MSNKHKGSTFDSFLEKEGLLEEAEAVAIKRVIVFELEKMMKKEHLSKVELAKRIHTSRSQLDRLLDPLNTSVTLTTIVKAAHAIGKKIKLTIGPITA
ncbi:MAG: XRE family transcriptional regulator [Gammaproteobacteria bacterium]|nr:XRE family transcriptional regulator [Gammaproteobacteria bacterium]